MLPIYPPIRVYPGIRYHSGRMYAASQKIEYQYDVRTYRNRARKCMYISVWKIINPNITGVVLILLFLFMCVYVVFLVCWLIIKPTNFLYLFCCTVFKGVASIEWESLLYNEKTTPKLKYRLWLTKKKGNNQWKKKICLFYLKIVNSSHWMLTCKNNVTKTS